ncbi:MAG TPA: amidohydrolase family protein [Nocardioidaceae bacterium]|nr:amidohydrolase family protein [Nocardioidaceae bacterium]
MRVGHAIDEQVLVDHHVHSLFDRDLSRAELEASITEARTPVGHPHTQFDSQLGFALRRHCAPVLGLPAFASAEEYVARRTELGFEEVSKRLLAAAGISDYCIDGGHRPHELMSTEAFEVLSGARVHEVLRLESAAEEAMANAASGHQFLDRLHAALGAARPVAFKTVAAYRCGLDLDPAKPADDEVASAAEHWHDEVWHGAPLRLMDPVLIRHLMWWALEQGRPLQVHTGFGDPDLELRSADPALLQPIIARSEQSPGRIVLLHCYPFERSAGYLAHAYPHVYVDVGLATGYLGANAETFLRGAMDLAPFHKLLFSTDAFGLPELVYLGARVWRSAMTRLLTAYVDQEGWPVSEAVRIARMFGTDNARALYAFS